MISIPQVKLGEHCCPLEQFKGGGEEWEGVAVLNCDIIKSTIVYTGPQRLVPLIHKNPAPAGDEEGRMISAATESCMYSSMAFLSGAEREYKSFWRQSARE